MSHTPTPWDYTMRTQKHGQQAWIKASGKTIFKGNYYGNEKNNAAFIVQAVNSFAAMKDACQTALDNLKPKYSSDHIVIRQLTHALTLAEGKEG